MKKLGFGCMRLPLINKEDNSSIDYEQTCQMFDYFLDNGFTYFDTAYMYHEYQSEKFVNDTFGGSLPAFLAAFTAKKSLSRE